MKTYYCYHVQQIVKSNLPKIKLLERTQAKLCVLGPCLYEMCIGNGGENTQTKLAQGLDRLPDN